MRGNFKNLTISDDYIGRFHISFEVFLDQIDRSMKKISVRNRIKAFQVLSERMTEEMSINFFKYLIISINFNGEVSRKFNLDKIFYRNS